MAVFNYEVMDRAGNITTGQMQAEDSQTVLNRLRNQGLMVVEVTEVAVKTSKGLFRRQRKVNIGDLSMFSRQLASMLDAGIPLTRALFTLSAESVNPQLREALQRIAVEVEAGQSFSEALKNHTKIFSNLYVGMVSAGEIGGSLDKTLLRLSDQLQKDKNLRDSIRAATFYPSMVLSFSVILMIVMLVYLVPVFMGMFPPGTKLPLPTQIIVLLSNSVRFRWYIWLVAAMAGQYGFRSFFGSTAGRALWDRLRFRVPAFGPILHKAAIASFARTFSTLLLGGISVMQALEASGAASGNSLVIGAVGHALERIQEGKNIAQPLEASGIFPPHDHQHDRCRGRDRAVAHPDAAHCGVLRGRSGDGDQGPRSPDRTLDADFRRDVGRRHGYRFVSADILGCSYGWKVSVGPWTIRFPAVRLPTLP